jgi:hypothetical protein
MNGLAWNFEPQAHQPGDGSAFVLVWWLEAALQNAEVSQTFVSVETFADFWNLSVY